MDNQLDSYIMDFNPLLDIPEYIRPDADNFVGDFLNRVLIIKSENYTDDLQIQYNDVLNMEIPRNHLKFDEEYFKKLIAGSVSLLFEEKKAIVSIIPELSQETINILIEALEYDRKSMFYITLVFYFKLIEFLIKLT